MATIKNERDILLQATSPRMIVSPLNYISVIPTTSTFTTLTGGTILPSDITVRGILNGALRGTISWTLSPAIAYTTIGNDINILGSNVSTGSSVLVTASITYLGNVYSSTVMITRKDIVTLNSNGTLTGEGGGSITALDYGSVSGSKPPANATANFFTTSTINPTGGSDGDAHWNSATSVMWFKTGGAWSAGGTVNASEIITGTLAAARIATNSLNADKIVSGSITATQIAASTITGANISAGTITTDKLNVTSLSAITANLGAVTAGAITGTSTIDIAGSARFAGSTIDGGSLYTVVCDAGSISSGGGLKGNAGIGGVGLYGDTGTVGDRGVAGVSRVYGSRGVQAINTAGGWALDVSGYMTINNTTLVTNLHADILDGYHGSSYCTGILCDVGTAYVSGFGLTLDSTVTGYQFRASGATIFHEATSDRSLKQDIVPETYGLAFINNLKPVQYRLISKPEKVHHGFIAQDVEPLISTLDDVLAQTHDNGIKGIDYLALISPLVKAVQELTRENELIKQRLQVLEHV